MNNFGTVTFEGKTYTLMQGAYCDYNANTDCTYYTATAIIDGEEKDEYGWQPAHRVTWEITNPDAENEDETCDWDEPEKVKPDGDYNAEQKIFG